MNKDLTTKELEDIFHKAVSSFKIRWLNKGTEISASGIYNYAISIMRYEFHNKFEEEDKNRILNIYKIT